MYLCLYLMADCDALAVEVVAELQLLLLRFLPEK